MRALNFIGLLLFARLAFAANPSDFDFANQLYDQGKFADAKQHYESVTHSENYSANLFYNLGNADVRLGDLGGAALNYERALALEPNHPEAHANLAFIRGETGAKVESRSWFDSLFLSLDANSYTIVATVSFWLAAACLLGVALRSRRETISLWFAACVGIALCAYASVAVWRIEKNNALAIVVTKRAEARFAPADSATLADNLPTGSRVRILSERGAWTYCELPNSTRAWIAAKEIERVKIGA